MGDVVFLKKRIMEREFDSTLKIDLEEEFKILQCDYCDGIFREGDLFFNVHGRLICKCCINSLVS